MQLIKSRVYAQWIIPGSVQTTDTKKKVRVNLKLERNGTVNNIEFIALSDNPLLNASVKDAIINAQPFPAFPKDLPDDSLDVIINFDPEK